MRELGGSALEDHLSTGVTGARTDVDHMVGMRHDLLTMLDKYECSAGVHQLIEELQQSADIGGVRPLVGSSRIRRGGSSSLTDPRCRARSSR